MDARRPSVDELADGVLDDASIDRCTLKQQRRVCRFAVIDLEIRDQLINLAYAAAPFRIQDAATGAVARGERCVVAGADEGAAVNDVVALASLEHAGITVVAGINGDVPD